MNLENYSFQRSSLNAKYMLKNLFKQFNKYILKKISPLFFPINDIYYELLQFFIPCLFFVYFADTLSNNIETNVINNKNFKLLGFSINEMLFSFYLFLR